MTLDQELLALIILQDMAVFPSMVVLIYILAGLAGNCWISPLSHHDSMLAKLCVFASVSFDVCLLGSQQVVHLGEGVCEVQGTGGNGYVGGGS